MTEPAKPARTLAEQVQAIAAAVQTLYPGLPVTAVYFDVEGLPKMPRFPLATEEAVIAADNPEARLKPRQRKMLAVLRSSPIPLTQKAVALRVTTKGRPTTRGSFGEEFRELVFLGFVKQQHDLYTDDETKWGATGSE